MSTAARLDEVRERIAAAARGAARAPDSVRLVAVAKTATDASLRAAWDAGQRDFGHNRVQPLEAHAAVLPAARWHLIGPLQSGKARRALRHAGVVHTVGDPSIAARLEQIRRDDGAAPLPVLVQVNLSPDDGRSGCPAAALPELLASVAGHPHLALRGLMTLAPQGLAADALHHHFAALRELAEGAAGDTLPAQPELSMGMSEDYEIAIAEGATLVRVGRAIFPPIPPSEPGL